ncbi:Gfo/Idh/MocA family protein [Endozoicomonas numazuensis]|uniref:Oxidoreductase n=1 Tax=Endozoicomonas numazuensis TaxID=1137799 RepID=A0A081NGU8_9GAMM|nr:Gfo/Idh/MocA family oxidoreductase [Endozoicomonas numazuensis]KEQ17671.1 oxidoreductase [Endozoicomonas numazuensis]
MKIAVIGLGSIAQKAYLPVLTQRADLELVFCTRNAEILNHLAKQYRISETCSNYRSLPKMGIDAVMIHSSTHSHFEITRFFLNTGLPVFVDKPLSDCYSQCEALYELSAKKSQPLFLGFNRRYLPLLKQHLDQDKPLMALRWEKHRHNLSGEPKTFIFDDFIHALDSINLQGNTSPEDLSIHFQRTGDHLSRLDIQWQSDEVLYQASMNRSAGKTREMIHADYLNTSFRFDSFLSGIQWQNNEEKALHLPDWTPMLKSKGFHDMIDHWINVVQKGQQSLELTKRNLNTHLLCDTIYEHVLDKTPD